MGALLQAIVTGAHVRERPDDASELGALLTELRERRGLDFSSYRPPTILRRLQRRMAAVHSDTLADYRRYLRENPD
jgi:two-component system CheB/CheR fusion protein